nr:immunoglobulin light chain junction region [Macaca mulatta]MOW02162.1 immunoglobulin light chain junction region [Macaca mulatta]MOW02182.1 immunoglobulin light chain junction region [Macaca mulatta]MOW02276.1 immunoglobulin light chain junction region [Macaca mulatta]MOW02280.1 immunoglobulin light chain junction region [Macaca mulatta]
DYYCCSYRTASTLVF